MGSKQNNSNAYFYKTTGDQYSGVTTRIIRIDLSAKTWTWTDYISEITSHKVNTIIGNENDLTYYPTTSAVYNFVMSDLKISKIISGIPDLSQTYTFTITAQERLLLFNGSSRQTSFKRRFRAYIRGNES